VLNIILGFLYFPEDKSEYIPALMTMVIFFIGALITFRILVKHSKKEEKKQERLQEKMLNDEKLKS
jgi:hypothetical protein